MGLRQRIWAGKVTELLREALGYKCADCGTSKKLTFDVINPVDFGEHHDYEWSWRMSFYRREHAQKNLQLLCEKCNAKKSNKVSFY